MIEPSSQAVETDSSDQESLAYLRPGGRAERVWPRRTSRGWRYALLRRMLAFADATAALLATLSLVAVGDSESSVLAWSLIYVPVWIVVAKLLGLYDRDARSLRHLTIDEASQLVVWALLGMSGLAIFLELTPAGRPDAASAVVGGVIAVVSAFLLRSSARLLWRVLTPPESVMFVGTAENARLMRRKLELFPELHLTIVDERGGLAHTAGVAEPWAGLVDRVVFAPASLSEQQINAILDKCRAEGTMLNVIPPYSAALGHAAELTHLAEIPLLHYRTSDIARSTLLLKRALDIVVSGVALLVLTPFFLLLAAAIKVDSPGPVLFTQIRVGMNGRRFRMLKFRTMVANAEELLADLVPFDKLPEPMFKLSDDPRVTRVGRKLRRWSLDELPQLLNVLKGDMSLVGPRPEQVDLVERYSPEQRRRLDVKPGLTGPMQVNGRGALSLDERLALELDYIENLSIGRDVRILGMTVSAVFRGNGAF